MSAEAVTYLSDRCWSGLACGAHQTRRNFELTGRAESPGCREGLAGEAPKYPVAEIDAMWVMGTASQCRVSALHRQASYLDTDIEERAAMRLDQRLILRGVPLKKEHDLRFHLLCDSQCRCMC